MASVPSIGLDRICYNEILGFLNKRYANFRKVSGNSDHGLAPCPERAVDFAPGCHGRLRVSGGSVHMRRPPPRFRPAPGMLHGYGRTVRNTISRQLHQHDSQHAFICTHRTPLVESHRGLELLPRRFELKLIAVPRSGTRSTTSPLFLIGHLRSMFAD